MSAAKDLAPAKRRGFDRARVVGLIQARGAILVLAVAMIAAGLTFRDFLHGGNLTDIVAAASFLGLVAIGQTFVIIMGGFDLSVGSLVSVGTVLAAYAAPSGWGAALVVPTAAGVAVVAAAS